MRNILVSILCVFVLFGCSNKVLEPKTEQNQLVQKTEEKQSEKVEKHYRVTYELYDNSDKNKAEKLLFSQTKETISSILYEGTENLTFGDLLKWGDYSSDINGNKELNKIENRFDSAISFIVKENTILYSMSFSIRGNDSKFANDCGEILVPNLITTYTTKEIDKKVPLVIQQEFEDYIVIVTIKE